jgi:hypothetical protein
VLTRHTLPRLKQYLVDTRNSIVTKSLTDIYKERVCPGTFKVFCVSNDDYWMLRNKPGDIARPLMQLSGIIAVRMHCISIVAESQLRAVKRFIRDSIPAILSEITLWVQSGAGSVSAERKQSLRESLSALESRLKTVSTYVIIQVIAEVMLNNQDLDGRSSRLNKSGRLIKQEFKAQLYDSMEPYLAVDYYGYLILAGKRINEWSQEAGTAADEWATVSIAIAILFNTPSSNNVRLVASL